MSVFIRTNTIQADPAKLDDGIAFAREHLPGALRELDGSLGWTMLVDRGSGECLVNSWWATERAMEDSRDALGQLREQAAEAFGAPVTPEHWEVAVMQRWRDVTVGCAVRRTRIHLDPSAMDHAIDVFRTTTVPEVSLMDGVCACSMSIDRSSGDALGAVVFESMDALVASRERGEKVRTTTAEKAGAEVLEVAEYEVVETQVSSPEHI